MKDTDFENKIIYADNAATTPLDDEVFDLLVDLQKKYFGNPSAVYKISKPVKKILSESREIIAECINAKPQEIYFTSGGTESDNTAIKSIMLENLSARPNVITSAVEHKAILNSCTAMKNLGCTVTKLPVNRFGAVNVDELEKKIRRQTKLISIMFANNEIGTIQPVEKISAVAREHGIIFHTDAVQAVGHIPIDAKNFDMLSASAHKFNAPKGIGFLFVREGVKILPFMDGGGQENNFRAGTENFPAIAAMALALKKNCEQMNSNAKKFSECAEVLLKILRENNIDFILNGGENRLPGHLSLSFKNCDGETLMHRLDLKNICVSTGSACNSKQIKISHVLKAIKLPTDYARGTIRITFGKKNTPRDAKTIAEVLAKIIKK